MAGLNDDVDEGLEDFEENSSNSSTPPNTNPDQPEPDPVLLVSQDFDSAEDKQSNPSIQDLFGETVIPGELPNFNAEFVILEDKDNTLNDFKSISLAIGSKRSICQEDARLLDSLAPGFLNDETKPIGYFTKDSTKTFFDETVRDMSTHVNNENNNINKDLINYITNIDKSYTDLLAVYETKYKILLVEQNRFIKKFFFDVLLNHNNEPSSLLNSSLNLNDLLNFPIKKIDSVNLAKDENLKNNLINLLEKFDNVNVESYLLSFQYVTNGSLVFVSNALNSNDDYFSINSMIKLHMNGSQAIVPYGILLKLANNQVKLNEIKNNCINNTTNDNLFETNKKVILQFIEDYKHLSKLTIGLINFNNAIIKILRLF